jgi:hypothetical protein
MPWILLTEKDPNFQSNTKMKRGVCGMMPSFGRNSSRKDNQLFMLSSRRNVTITY